VFCNTNQLCALLVQTKRSPVANVAVSLYYKTLASQSRFKTKELTVFLVIKEFLEAVGDTETCGFL
jgi:hypothetical protein